MTGAEAWMPFGFVDAPDLDQNAGAIEMLQESLRDAGAELMNEEAPSDAGATAAEGEIQNTITHEGDQNMTHITTTLETSATDAAAVLALIDECPEGQVMILAADDFGHVEFPNTWTRPVTEFRDDITAELLREDIENMQTHWFGRWFTQDGTPIPLGTRDQSWVDRETVPSTLRHLPLSAWKSPSGHLFVSDGLWVPVAEHEVDGEPAFEFIRAGEAFARRERADEVRYLDEHPEIRAAQPAWANSTEIVWLDGDDAADVSYERQFGRVSLSMGAHHDAGTLTFDDPTASFDAENLPLTEMRALAAALVDAIAALEGEER